MQQRRSAEFLCRVTSPQLQHLAVGPIEGLHIQINRSGLVLLLEADLEQGPKIWNLLQLTQAPALQKALAQLTLERARGVGM